MKKTFKIGEYAIGGIISVEKNSKWIGITAKDWTTKEVVASHTISTEDDLCYCRLANWLHDWTSCFYADKIMDWIQPRYEE